MSRVFSLSEAASIAIHSMVLIARAKNGINVVKITEVTGFSKNHIAKVLQRLVKADMLRSVRGPAGGFYLKKEAGGITFLEIYEAIEGPMEETDCPLSYVLCNYDSCIMGTIINEMTGEFKKYLENKTLASFN
ncbi:MAG: Rrf2 family transcriptional regulator [Bacteroidales bacterium]|nr:Rrf2 family transcriptional regulator [Bacteroidota bacterium]MBL6950063.1 Rrf2 family transcriptional regulator [Bacteroidales bacterium]